MRLSGPHGGDESSTIELMAFAPLSITTALAFAWAARQERSLLLRRAFGLYALSFSLTSLGSLVSVVQSWLLDVDPTYSWPNLAYLLSYPCAMVAILLLPLNRFEREERLRLVLETAIAVVAAVVLTWYALQPLAGTTASVAERIVLFAFPTGDLIVFAVLIPLLLNLRRHQDARALKLLGVAQMFYIGADIAYLLVGVVPGAWLPFGADALYLLGYIGLIRTAELVVLEGAGDGKKPTSLVALPARNPLPFALGLIVYATLLGAAVRGDGERVPVLTGAAVTITLLMLTREWFTERLNVRLVRDLEVARADARLHDVLANLTTGVVVINTAGQPTLNNASAVGFLNAASPDAFALGVATDPLFAPARAALRTGEAQGQSVIPAPPRTQWDSTKWIMVSADARRGATGAVEEVVCTLQDVTAQRELDDRLRQSQRLEAVGQLASGVAHDFNNLLAAVTGYASLIQLEVASDTAVHGHAVEIVRASQRASALTQQLLAYGRRQTLRPQATEPNELLRDVERTVRATLPHGVTLAMDLGDDLPHILVDPVQIERVLVNLAVNARDAMEGPGTIILASRYAKLASDIPAHRTLPSKGGVVLEVRDTGKGMSPEVLARAFEPFFTTKPLGKGTGLGLSTVHGIVHQSRGDVWLESELGRGTTAYVLLPVVGSL